MAILSTFLEKARSALASPDAISRPTGGANVPARDLKSWTYDPFQYLDSFTHRERRSQLTFDNLRLMAERTDVIAAIINTRISQCASFARPQQSRFEYGYVIRMLDKRKSPNTAAQKLIEQISRFVNHCGIDEGAQHRDCFEDWLRKYMRDSLIYDQAVYEIVPRRNGMPAFFEAIDSATIRIAAKEPPKTDDLGRIIPQSFHAPGSGQYEKTFGRPDISQQGGQTSLTAAIQDFDRLLRAQDYQGNIVPAAYVQVIDGAVRTTYAESEIFFGTRNKRTNLGAGGYGQSELEILIHAITGILWAEEYNRRYFSQGSMPKGLLNVKGEISEKQLESFRREWVSLVAGVHNSWKTPVINAEGVEYTNLNLSNRDMEFMQWIQFLVRMVSAVYLIDPSEIGFDMPRFLTQQNPMIESGPEQKIKHSKDKGLQPMLRFIERSINEGIVARLDEDFVFEFVGLQMRTPDQLMDDSVKKIQYYQTVNEIRAENDLEDVSEEQGGEMILNPIIAQKQAMEQQLEMQREQEERAQQDETQQAEADQSASDNEMLFPQAQGAEAPQEVAKALTSETILLKSRRAKKKVFEVEL